MKIVILLCFTLIACISAQKCTPDQLKQYKKWQNDFNRPIYDEETEAKRCLNLLKVLEHIKKHSTNNKKHKMGLNSLSDLSPEEYKERFGLQIPDNYKHNAGPHKSKRQTQSYPATRDWRNHRIINPVQNQGMSTVTS